VSALDVIVVYLPVFGESRGLPPSVVGVLLGVLFAATIVSRLFLRRLRRIASPPLLLTLSAALPAICFGFTPFVVEPILLGVLFAAAGTGLGIGQPTSMWWVSSMVPRHVRATTLGLRLAGNRLAQIVVPITVGVLAFSLGIATVFWALAALLILSALFTARSIRGKALEPED
jgi:sugar phosphate permease